MDTEKKLTLSREGDGPLPEGLVPSNGARPTVVDHSQYDITEARVGDLSARVFRQPAIRGGLSQPWHYRIEWRGLCLWSEIVDDLERSEIEETAVRQMRKLAHVVAVVEGDMERVLDLAVAKPVVPTWVALPDHLDDPDQ